MKQHLVSDTWIKISYINLIALLLASTATTGTGACASTTTILHGLMWTLIACTKSTLMMWLLLWRH